MRGLWVQDGRVVLRDDLPEPRPVPGETRVRVLRAGVCATDLALLRGYMGFRGVPGHEFVGLALEGPFEGRRVVGEINAACGECSTCRGGQPRHCPRRTVLGILNRPGAFAELLCLPQTNLHPVPEGVSTDAATFTEPLAAAFEIAEQVELVPGSRAVVVGDGRLGLLCAQVLDLHGLSVDLVGHHPERRALLADAIRFRRELALAPDEPPWDLAVEASGRPEVLPSVFKCLRPRATLVLKTTAESPAELDLAPAVIDELVLVGSRCGPFEPALEALADGRIAVEPLIHGRYPLTAGPQALAQADRPGVLKILIDVPAEGALPPS